MMTGPDGKPTVAWRLFNDRWLCAVPEMYLYDQKYIDQVGRVTTGNKQIDNMLAHTRRDIYLTVVGIAMYHDEGAPVRLRNPKDAIPIYKMLTEHLQNWKTVIETQFNFKAPIDDLRKMDALAGAIFPLAAQWEEFDPKTRGIFEHLAKLNRTKLSLHAPQKVVTEHARILEGMTGEAPAPQTIEMMAKETHTPIADAIARQLFQRNE